jgi:hypothetical protein
MKRPPSDVQASRRPGARPKDQLVALIGTEVVRFQDESTAFDDVAARILALERGDLPCMTMLLFGGPASVDQLRTALHAERGAITATVDRLQLAGYARRRPEGDQSWIELTDRSLTSSRGKSKSFAVARPASATSRCPSPCGTNAKSPGRKNWVAPLDLERRQGMSQGT